MNKGIVLVWPSHVDFKETIVKELYENNYTILEQQELAVTKKFIKNILLEIHYGKEWWDQNIDNEYTKRINTKMPDNAQLLHYIIVEKENIHMTLKSFKKSTRGKYGLDKSYFHISDPDCLRHLGQNCNCECNISDFNKELRKHIDMLTNANTIHFLNHAVHNRTYNFNNFFRTYRIGLLNSRINADNFCIDNGGILAAYGIRDTHDLDFLTTFNDNIKVNDPNIGCENKNHRLEYTRLGYSIEDIIKNPENHFYHFGMKFMALHVLKKFKFNRTHTIGTGHNQIRQKDINDYRAINRLTFI